MHRRPGSNAAFAAARALAIATLVVTGALGAAPPPTPSLAQAAVAVYKLTGPGATPAAPWKSALLEGLVWRALSAAPGIVASVEVLPPPADTDGNDATSTLASVRVRGVGGAGDLTALWSFLGTNATAALNDGVAALGLPGWDVRASLVSVSAEEVGTVNGGQGKKGGGGPLAVPAEARVKPGAAAPGPAPVAVPTVTVAVPTTPAATAAPPSTPAATAAPPPTPAATAAPPPPPPPSSPTPTPTPEPKPKRDTVVAAVSPAPAPFLAAAQPPSNAGAGQPAPPAHPPAGATQTPAPAPSTRPAIFAPSGAAATAGAAVPVALTLRLAGAEGAPLDAPAARAALSAAVSQAATEVGLAVEDAQVLDVQRSTAPFPNPRRALRQTPPSPSPPHPQVVDARVAVVGAPRASRRSGVGTSRDTAESLLSSPAFAAAVKRGMAAAGFPVDVAVVGVSATGAVAAAPAVSAGPTVAPARRDPPAVAAASAAAASKAGVIAGALAGVAAVGGVLAAAALFAARGARAVRARLPSSADGGADKDAAAAAAAAITVVDDADTFHDATADGAASECGTDAGVAALAATPGVSRVMAALRAAAAARAAAVAAAAPPPAGDVLGGRYVVGERLGRRVCAARDMEAAAAPASTDVADPGSVVLKLYDAADAAAADALVSLTRHGGPGGCPLVGVLPVTADVTIPPALRILISPRGQFSLADWLAGTRGRRPDRGTAAARYTAAAVATRVAALHSARVAHRVLDPRRFVWRGGDWWLTVTAAAAAVVGGKRHAAPAVVVGALRYAAPETVAAVAAGHRTLAPSLAADAWSLGVILYEVFAGKPLFPAAARDAAVAGALLGLAPLPTEASSSAWRAVRDPAARVLLQGLLVREPGARLTVEDALKSPALGGV